MAAWLSFALLTIFWGSSFLWIKIALVEVSFDLLVAMRLTFAFLVLFVVFLRKGEKFPRSKKIWMEVTYLSLFSPLIPFYLITWAETRISSAAAALLNGTVPLFAFVIAHFFVAGEKFRSKRAIFGLFVGFAGIVFIYWKDAEQELLSLSGSSLSGKAAVTLAALLYAVHAALAKSSVKKVSRIAFSTSTMLVGAVLAWANIFLRSETLLWPQKGLSWVALLWLGVLGTGLAFTLYFYLIEVWGAAKSTLVTYTFPVVGFLLGMIFLGEKASWNLFVGAICIVFSVLSLRAAPRSAR